jgi:hypothetical protein
MRAVPVRAVPVQEVPGKEVVVRFVNIISVHGHTIAISNDISFVYRL